MPAIKSAHHRLHPRDADEAATFVKRGYDFVSIATDVALLQQAIASGIARVRRG